MDWTQRAPVPRRFPGPASADVALRVAIDRAPYADLVAHGKGSLEAEICGVLCGDTCEDEHGTWVHIQAVIAGAAARGDSTHVTFTQETWTAIHADLEKECPQLSIVGWYHTHPGFGVVFSDMDIFIQQSFFAGPAQIALVADPLGGQEALCINGAEGIRYLDRFWVDGRERRTTMPVGQQEAPAGGTSPVAALERMETRLAQAIQTIEEQRRSLQGFIVFASVAILLSIAGTVGWTLWTHVVNPPEPPQLRSYIPVPIRIGDQTVLLGVGVADWAVPARLNAAYLELERQRLIHEADSARAAAGHPAPDSTNRGRP